MLVDGIALVKRQDSVDGIPMPRGVVAVGVEVRDEGCKFEVETAYGYFVRTPLDMDRLFGHTLAFLAPEMLSALVGNVFLRCIYLV